MRVFAKITVSGNDLKGYNSTTVIGGEDVGDYIELLSFSIGADRTVSSSGQLSGHPDYRRLTLNKRLDAASPGLLSALARGETTEVQLKVFGKSSTSGLMNLDFQLTITDGRISGVDWDGVSGNEYAEETVQLAYGGMTAENHAGTATSVQITTAASA